MTELCEKYGFHRLARFREFAYKIPESMPEQAAMQVRFLADFFFIKVMRYSFLI